MRKKSRILTGVILFVVLGAGVWMFFRPGIAVVIKGSLPPIYIAAVKSAVKQDMARRVFPQFSWPIVKALPANLRAYFRYNILQIESSMSSNVNVTVGDGTTVMASKHVCEYGLLKEGGRWKICVIFATSSS